MKRWISNLRSLSAGILAACLASFVANPVFAQGVGQGDGASSGIASPDPGYLTALNAPIRSVAPSRLNTLERREFNAEDMERARLEMNDSEIKQDIAEQLTYAGVTCAVKGFKRVGTTPTAKSIYEAACNNGPGYVLINGAEPRATNCLVLAGGAAAARRRNPDAPVGAQCTLPENQNGLEVIGTLARQAGVDCRIDDAEWIGSSEDGSDIFEVGCAGSEGYWLEQVAASWSAKGCIEVDAEGLTCRFTTPVEQHAWMRSLLTATPAAACDISDIRMVGVSSEGRHYETRCAAADEGFLVRIARDGRARDVTPCTAAANQAIGCTLTNPGSTRASSLSL